VKEPQVTDKKGRGGRASGEDLKKQFARQLVDLRRLYEEAARADDYNACRTLVERLWWTSLEPGEDPRAGWVVEQQARHGNQWAPYIQPMD
jgi:hypothetical protein